MVCRNCPKLIRWSEGGIWYYRCGIGGAELTDDDLNEELPCVGDYHTIERALAAFYLDGRRRLGAQHGRRPRSDKGKRRGPYRRRVT